MFFGRGPHRIGEGHDRLGTDWVGGDLIAGRSYLCDGPIWSGHRWVSTGHAKPELLRPIRLLRLLRATSSLSAWTTPLGFWGFGSTLPLTALAPPVGGSTNK